MIFAALILQYLPIHTYKLTASKRPRVILILVEHWIISWSKVQHLRIHNNIQEPIFRNKIGTISAIYFSATCESRKSGSVGFLS